MSDGVGPCCKSCDVTKVDDGWYCQASCQAPWSLSLSMVGATGGCGQGGVALCVVYGGHALRVGSVCGQIGPGLTTLFCGRMAYVMPGSAFFSDWLCFLGCWVGSDMLCGARVLVP